MIDLIGRIKQRRTVYTQALFAVLAFLLMVLIFYIFMRENTRQNILRNTESLLDYEEYQIHSKLLESQITLTGYSRTVRGMILHGNTAEDLQRYMSDLAVYIDKTRIYNSSINKMHSYIEAMPGGPVYITESALDYSFDPSQAEWYRKAVEAHGEIAETLTIAEAAEKETFFTYSICLHDNDGRQLGVVCIDIGFDEIITDIVKIAANQSGIGILINHDLTVLVHNNKNYIGLNMREPLFPFSIFADDLLNGVDITERPIINYLGEPSVAFFRHLQNDWYLGLVISKGPYYQSIINMAMVLFALGLTFAAAFVLILVRTSINSENIQLLLDKTPLSVHLWDRDLNLIDCNEQSVKLFNVKDKKELKERFLDLSPEYQPDGQLTKDKLEKTLKKAFYEKIPAWSGCTKLLTAS
jgi:PAS domain-containing protein